MERKVRQKSTVGLNMKYILCLNRMEIVIDDDMVAPVSEAIVDAAKTGQIGDGKIFVLSVDSATRIRTGETGSDAL